MISNVVALSVKAYGKRIIVPQAKKAWSRVAAIDKELDKDMLPIIRIRRMQERQRILNAVRISYT